RTLKSLAARFRTPTPPRSTRFPYTTLFRSPVQRRRSPTTQRQRSGIDRPGTLAQRKGSARSRRQRHCLASSRYPLQIQVGRIGEDHQSNRLNHSHVANSVVVVYLNQSPTTQ